MIVRTESDGSLVMITQNDHAQAAGFCAAHWGNAQFEKPRPYESAVRAAYLHDLVWLQEESLPRFNREIGQTLNYLIVPNETQLAEHQWADDWLYSLDHYAGLLVAKHRTGIWNARYGMMKQPQYVQRTLHPDIEEFIARSHEKQNAGRAGLDQHELDVNYILLQVWDLFSLYICSNENLKEQIVDPVPTGYSGQPGVRMRLNPVGPRRISIDPYPFDTPELVVNVVYRRLPKAKFDNEDEFRATFFAAPAETAKFTFFDPAAGQK